MNEHEPTPATNDETDAYQPPVAEDIDLTAGTAVTAAGALITVK